MVHSAAEGGLFLRLSSLPLRSGEGLATALVDGDRRLWQQGSRRNTFMACCHFHDMLGFELFMGFVCGFFYGCFLRLFYDICLRLILVFSPLGHENASSVARMCQRN